MATLCKCSEAFNLDRPASELILEAIEEGDENVVKRILNSSIDEFKRCVEIYGVKTIDKSFPLTISAFDAQRPLGSCITCSDWLEALYQSGKFRGRTCCGPIAVRELGHRLYRIKKRLSNISYFVGNVTETCWTGLHLAMYQCQGTFGEYHLEKVKYLLSLRIFDVNALTNDFETVLHFACRCETDGRNYRKLKSIIRDFLYHKLDVNQKNSYGQTPLMIASQTGCIAGVHALLKWNHSNGFQLDLNAKDNRDRSALAIAKQSGNAKIVAMIEQALFLNAVENADLETVKIYLQCETSELQLHSNDPKFEFLHLRPESEIDHNVDCADHTLNKRSSELRQFPLNYSISYSGWWKALMIAYLKDHDDIFQLLLNDDLYDLGVREHGHTVLHLAAQEFLANMSLQKSYMKNRREYKILEKIKLLLKSNKCDVNASNFKKETVLHLICNMSNLGDDSFRPYGILEVLLKHTIDLNCRNNIGKTALMLACENGLEVIVRWLLDAKKDGKADLDLSVVSYSSETALNIAKRKSNPEIVDMIQEAILFAAVETQNEFALKSILEEAGNNDERFVLLSTAIIYRREMAKAWIWKPVYPFHYLTWKKAVTRAIEKSDDDILKLLLDYEPIVQCQSIGWLEGNSVIHQFVSDEGKFTLKHLRSLEILLKSGKVNVNALNFEAQTAMHTIFKMRSENDHDIIADLTLLLLRHGAIVNQRDKNGMTLLMMASIDGRDYIVRKILDWAKETDSWVDLDAKDVRGYTALMMAARWKHVGVVEMLLGAAASVNLSDNRGFTPLHHALYETLTPAAWINFGDLPRNFEEFQNRKERNIILLEMEEEPHVEYKRNRSKMNDDKMSIVALLVNGSYADVNALDCEGYSPLDIAEALFPEIPSSIKDALGQKGATLNAFQNQNQQSLSSEDIDYGCQKSLHRLAYELIRYQDYQIDRGSSSSFSPLVYYKIKQKFVQLGTVAQKDMISSRDLKGRTSLHCAIISHQDRDTYFYLEPICGRGFICHREDIHNFDNFLRTLISLGCNVNEIDNFGRTPLHYAFNHDTSVRKLLMSTGADPEIKDRDGIKAIDMASISKGTHTDRFHNLSSPVKSIVDDVIRRICKSDERHVEEKVLMKQIQSLETDPKIHWCRHLNPKSISGGIWRVGEYASRLPTTDQVRREVTDFVECMALEIKRQDQRFECKPFLVGSAYEGTKVDGPDAFVFHLILTKFSELSEVFPSPELPPGFVHLRRKQTRGDETQDAEFRDYFNENGILISEKINAQFKILLANLLTDTRFIQSQQNNFEWKCHLRKGARHDRQHLDLGLANTLKLTKTKLDLEDKHCFKDISLCIVPCIHIEGWWPDEAISNASDEAKAVGCNLVFDRPQSLYPWVPISDSCVRISFAPAESKMIKLSSDTAKQAYMIGKQLLRKTSQTFRRFKTSHILKTSFLYCIEAFASKPDAVGGVGLSAVPGASKSPLNRVDVHLWLETIMKCYLDFVLQDFYPCYFMPTFSLPIFIFPKYNLIHCWKGDDTLIEHSFVAILLYLAVKQDASELCFQLPPLQLVIENSDRNVVVAGLFKYASEKSGRQTVEYDTNGSEYCDGFCSSS